MEVHRNLWMSTSVKGRENRYVLKLITCWMNKDLTNDDKHPTVVPQLRRRLMNERTVLSQRHSIARISSVNKKTFREIPDDNKNNNLEMEVSQRIEIRK